MSDIKKLLTVMNQHHASDLYITADSAPAFRINGVVRTAGDRSLTDKDTAALAFTLLSNEQKNEFLDQNELNLALVYEDLGRYRCNIFRQRGAIGMVIRRIVTDIPSMEELNLPSVFRDIVMSKRGLILVVGATGSGKSTTLASMIDYRNRNEAGHIITIEDPVEFVHFHKKSLITQREVGVDTVSYKNALKNTLRQAPDVILIGEVRDVETMEAAVTFAETGHLCLATLHSNNANQALERVLNFFPPERHRQIYLQLSLNLNAVISQRLVKTKTGGRSAAVEIMRDSPLIKDLIKRGEVDLIKEAIEKGTTMGMQSFDMHLYRLFADGAITKEEALRNADSENNLRLKIKVNDENAIEEEPSGSAVFGNKKKAGTVKEEAGTGSQLRLEN